MCNLNTVDIRNKNMHIPEYGCILEYACVNASNEAPFVGRVALFPMLMDKKDLKHFLYTIHMN